MLFRWPRKCWYAVLAHTIQLQAPRYGDILALFSFYIAENLHLYSLAVIE